MIYHRHAAKSKNLGGQVVKRDAAAARRRLLIRQGGQGGPAAHPLPTCLYQYLPLDSLTISKYLSMHVWFP